MTHSSAGGGPGWRVVLQREFSTAGLGDCMRYTVAGIETPVRILLVSCDYAADTAVQDTWQAIDDALPQMRATSFPCGGPHMGACNTWNEPACHHILVFLIGDQNLHSKFETMTSDWMTKSSRVVILPALLPGLLHVDVFGANAHPQLGKRTLSGWKGNPAQLAQEILDAALLDTRPSVFLSYTRRDATARADEIADALGAVGYQVYVDRRTGGKGQHFPRELREEIVNRDLVLLLESPQVGGSSWTCWEAALAARYLVGPAAVHFDYGTKLRSTRHRLPMGVPVTAKLSSVQLDQIVSFTRDKLAALAVTRRAAFETIAERAASSRGASIQLGNGGYLSVTKSKAERAGVVVSGVPGRLRHAQRLSGVTAGVPRFLAGDHAHLSYSDAVDLKWLAPLANITLVSKASVYSAVRSAAG